MNPFAREIFDCLFVLAQENQDDTKSEGEGRTIQMTEDFYSNYRLFGKKK